MSNKLEDIKNTKRERKRKLVINIYCEMKLSNNNKKKW